MRSPSEGLLKAGEPLLIPSFYSHYGAVMSDVKPKFRRDVLKRTFSGSHAGAVVLEDPVANKFFRISPYEYELLNILDGTYTIPEAVERLKLRGRHFTLEHAARLVDQFSRAGLLLGTSYGTSQAQSIFKKHMDTEKRSRSILQVYYLYLPLINPDAFLAKALPIWRFFVNKITLTFFLALIPGAGYLLVMGIPKMKAEYLFFFNMRNLLALWIAIALVKLVHEFAHAFTAKSFGLRVPEMGVAFLIFFPCLYCNTTAAWRLADRHERLVIAAAGIISEFLAAVIATYIWYFTQPGLVNSIAFYLMAISLASSLFFNGNPLLKLDGYFILTDLLQLPNLQGKSFAHLRWLIQNRALGVDAVTDVPDGPQKKLIYTTYGIAAFTYRVFLYIGITAGVYHRFDKTIGVIMGITIFSMMVMRPVLRTTVSLYAKRSDMNFRPRGFAVLLGLIILGIVLLTRPWSDHSVYPCYLESGRTLQLAVPADAPIEKVFVRQGDRVREGQDLFSLNVIPLEYILKRKSLEEEVIRKSISIIESSQKDLWGLPIKSIELSQAQDAVSKAKLDLSRARIIAPFDGVITQLSPALQSGAHFGKGTIVGEIAATTDAVVYGLVPESDVSGLQEGAQVKVWFPIGEEKTQLLKVTEMSAFKAEDLEGSPFSSRFGGEIATEQKQEIAKDAPLDPYYLCKLAFPNEEKIPLGATGRLVVQHTPRSLLDRIREAVYKTFHRELPF